MIRGTIVSAAIAAVCLAGALAMAPKELPPPTFEDTGEALFPDFHDPTLATSLEVVTWDEQAASVAKFKVEQKEGRWVIPSHNDYPADATEQMGKAAASFVEIKRDIYYGDNPEEHAEFGVLDPEGDEGKGDEKGKRITIADASGTVLVDVVVGKEVPDKEGFLYVRFPDSKRVYGSRMELAVSTEFTEWIEKDLLHVERDEIVALVSNSYTVDEKVGKVNNLRPVRADHRKRTDEGGVERQEWIIDPQVKAPAGKEFDQSKYRQIVGALARLQIVGVRPRPKRLTLDTLLSKGFFVNRGSQRLFGNEGELVVVTNDGVVYTLYFGEVTFESGVALTAGGGAGEPGGEGDKGAANRFLFVDVRFDANEVRDEAESAEEAPNDKAQAGPKGEARVAKLSERFDKWFFVISDTSFKQIHKEFDVLFKEKKN